MMRRLHQALIFGSAAALESPLCVYTFFVFPLIPLIWPSALNIVQFVSSGVLQLVALPILAVAGAVQARRTREEADAQHAEMKEILADVRAIADAIHVHLKPSAS